MLLTFDTALDLPQKRRSKADRDCTQCGLPATLLCEHADVDGTMSNTAYCSTACQSTDWPAHKGTCTAGRRRLQLYRGAQLLREIFFTVREQAYDTFIEKVTKGDDERLHLFETPPRGDEVLSPFVELSAKTFDVTDREEILSSLACSDTSILLVNMIQKAFGGEPTPPSRICALR